MNIDEIKTRLERNEVPFKEELPEKPVTLAIQEVADGKLSAGLKEEYRN